VYFHITAGKSSFINSKIFVVSHETGTVGHRCKYQLPDINGSTVIQTLGNLFTLSLYKTLLVFNKLHK